MVNRFLHPVDRKISDELKWRMHTFERKETIYFTYSRTPTRAKLFSTFLAVVLLCRHAHKVVKHV